MTIDIENNSSETRPRTAASMVGYKNQVPNPEWPGGAKVAVSFVLNIEEGAEYTIRNGDNRAEMYLNEYGIDAETYPHVDRININMESQYDYGSRAGVWRIFEAFKEHNMPLTIYGVAYSLCKVPRLAEVIHEQGWEMGSHGCRWIEHYNLPADVEKEQIREGVKLFQGMSPKGAAPVGWYLGRPSPRTRGLIAEVYREEGLPSLTWQSDDYSDDVPFWIPYPGGTKDQGLLILPYSYDNNDFKFSRGGGWTSSRAFNEYLTDAFDQLYEEGEAGSPKMMTIGLHCRVIGKPGRFPALTKFMEHIASKPKGSVWVATREQIANHWAEKYPYDYTKEY
ncbi:hypothetical protein I316_05916 [Kwoniella heveanensis BCC8398]|uniref:NodB homology domain-containing protein n=1 Tax=Kwoniella heveanensis BCC8398 TaxID=1296120 RepID=A0A1B9GN98_9TREE|nr:hypothetical protein I316_05916 [Kwoniella heveanensis BCC8398]